MVSFALLFICVSQGFGPARLGVAALRRTLVRILRFQFRLLLTDDLQRTASPHIVTRHLANCARLRHQQARQRAPFSQLPVLVSITTSWSVSVCDHQRLPTFTGGGAFAALRVPDPVRPRGSSPSSRHRPNSLARLRPVPYPTHRLFCYRSRLFCCRNYRLPSPAGCFKEPTTIQA